MTINSISGPQQSAQVDRAANKRVEDRPKTEERRVRKDTLELSSKAQELRDSQRSTNLQEIQNQINAGEFDKPEVIQATAQKILLDL